MLAFSFLFFFTTEKNMKIMKSSCVLRGRGFSDGVVWCVVGAAPLFLLLRVCVCALVPHVRDEYT